MRVEYSRHFVKMLEKCPKKIQMVFKEKLTLFLENELAPPLNNHPLFGGYEGCRSINITGDWRAVFKKDNGIAYFVALGTHSQLYK